MARELRSKSFDEKVWLKLKEIPYGRVTTYKAIAIALGKPNAARAVGNACRKNSSAPAVPCHRVVKSNGEIGGYAAGVKKKIELLSAEGINVRNGFVQDFFLVKWKFI